jgi:hypothetical protein
MRMQDEMKNISDEMIESVRKTSERIRQDEAYERKQRELEEDKQRASSLVLHLMHNPGLRVADALTDDDLSVLLRVTRRKT